MRSLRAKAQRCTQWWAARKHLVAWGALVLLGLWVLGVLAGAIAFFVLLVRLAYGDASSRRYSPPLPPTQETSEPPEDAPIIWHDLPEDF